MKRPILFAIVFALMELSVAQASAGEKKLCEDNRNALDEAACLSEVLTTYERELGLTIDAIISRSKWTAGDKPYEDFVAAQDRWSDDMRATCDVLVPNIYGEGSLSKSKPLRCRVKMVKERIRLLEDIYRSTLRN